MRTVKIKSPADRVTFKIPSPAYDYLRSIVQEAMNSGYTDLTIDRYCRNIVMSHLGQVKAEADEFFRSQREAKNGHPPGDISLDEATNESEPSIEETRVQEVSEDATPTSGSPSDPGEDL